jgi:tryptophan 2,3-dioxygenase
MDRMIRYFNHLISSFDVMVDGMDHKQFNQFRMALLPASGFQSGQFRKIELCFTSLGQLLDPSMDKRLDRSFNDLYENIYWKKGAIDLKTGKKTLTLEQFEKEYDTQFIALAKEYESKNLRAEILKHEGKEGFADLRDKAKSLDVALNINWRLSHYRAAVRYLARAEDKSAGATGGTNWQKFLPPRFQKLVSFPEFWSKAELDEWGKNWVENELGL